MRTATTARLLLAPLILLAGACDDSFSPSGGPAVGEAAHQTNATLADPGFWADGYMRVTDKAASVSIPVSDRSFNRSGGAMTATRVPGTTGRYVVRFQGLSALLGGRSSVRVTAGGSDLTYCKPIGGSLVRDSVEVRCFRIGTGAAANSQFNVTIAGQRDDRAFAYAHKPAATGYAPASAGSSNPAGATRVYREGLGRYRVVFGGIAGRLAPNVAGHVQVNAVGAGKAYCQLQGWGSGGGPDLSVYVGCHTPSGAPADAKFTALFTPPAAHLAYAFAHAATTGEYPADPVYGSNPVGGAITIRRFGVGRYSVTWTGVNGEIRDYGNVQVAAYGTKGAHCKLDGVLQNDGSPLTCYAANGALMDAQYVIVLHS